MTKRYDYAKIFKQGDSEILYARGLLTIDVIGLTKTTTGKLVVPTFRIDEEGNMQNFFFKDGEPLTLYNFRGDGKEKVLNQPKMVGKTKEKKLFLWVNEQGEDSWYRLEAWDVIAKRLNMFYKKGQEVVIIAHKVVSNGAETGKPETIWVIEDINKVEKDIIYKSKTKAETEKEGTTDGFAPIENEPDLPFSDGFR